MKNCFLPLAFLAGLISCAYAQSLPSVTFGISTVESLSAPSAYRQFSTQVLPTGQVEWDMESSTGALFTKSAWFWPWVQIGGMFPGLQTQVAPLQIYNLIGGLPLVGRLNTYPMPNPTVLPTVTHSGSGGSGSPNYYLRCLDANGGYSLPTRYAASDAGGWSTSQLSSAHYNTIAYNCPPGYSNAALFRDDPLNGFINTYLGGIYGVVSNLGGYCGANNCTYNDTGVATTTWASVTGAFYVTPDANTSGTALLGDWAIFQRGFTSWGGTANYGSVTVGALPDPSTGPTVTANTTGSTSYTYYQVFSDKNGKWSNISPGTTITNGAATPNNTVTCSPPSASYYSCTILRNSMSGVLVSGISIQQSYQNIITDTGGSTTTYIFPGRNTTADVNVSGAVSASAGYVSNGVSGVSCSGSPSSSYTVINGIVTHC